VIDQLVAVDAGQETERRAGSLAIEDWWHGQLPGQPWRQRGRLAGPPLRRIWTLIGLDDG
jgi:hypothetical protein